MTLSMWPRYRSNARRPAAVRRYSVLGMRPSKYLLQVTYCASSSLRACTLRFPSVVLSSCLRSLKVSESLTARALTIASLTRSCMSLSRSAAAAGPSVGFEPARLGSREVAGSVCCCCSDAFVLLLSFASAFCLATVVPRYVKSENYVQQAEARGHQRVAPPRGQEERARAQEHKAQAHHRPGPHGERAARHGARAVEQQPQAGKLPAEPGPVADDREERAHEHGRREVDDEL